MGSRPGAPARWVNPLRQKPPLFTDGGANPTFCFHSEIGVALNAGNALSWTDYISSVPVSQGISAQQPPVGADGTNFNGRTVIQGANTGNKYLENTAIGFNLFTTAMRPCLFGVFRLRNLVATNGAYSLFWMGFDTSANPFAFRLNKVVSTVYQAKTCDASTITNAGTADTSVHFVQIWNDGTNDNCKIDSTLVQSANTSNLSANITRLDIGYRGSGAVVPDLSSALWLGYDALPPQKYCDALRAWTNMYYGTIPA